MVRPGNRGTEPGRPTSPPEKYWENLGRSHINSDLGNKLVFVKNGSLFKD